MKENNDIPKFASIITILLGCYDLLRGFMHTVLLNYSAINIAGLDLSTSTASDQLRLLGAFGMSNFVSGVALILIGLYARKIALAMLAVIPSAYFIGNLGVKANLATYAPSQTNWGGREPMLVYFGICVVTFIAGMIMMGIRKKKAQSGQQ